MSLQVLLAHLLTLSPSATSQIFSSVTGFIVGNVFPLTESTNSLLIKTYLIEEKFFIIKLLAILSTYIKSQFFKLKKKSVASTKYLSRNSADPHSSSWLLCKLWNHSFAGPSTRYQFQRSPQCLLVATILQNEKTLQETNYLQPSIIFSDPIWWCRVMSSIPEGRGTPLYKPYSIGMCHPNLCVFWSGIRYSFWGNYSSAWMFLPFPFHVNKRERIICELEKDFKKPFVGVLISVMHEWGNFCLCKHD